MSVFESALPALNAAFIGTFSNCSVAWSGGSASGVFNSGSSESFGMLTRENTVACLSTAVAALAVDTAITLNGVAHTVRELRPDSMGMTTLVVETA